jgi:hypothetical protein
MFCSNCGTEARDSKFCPGCGQSMTQAGPGPQAPIEQPAERKEDRKKAGGFWTSGAGIALVVVLGVLVLAGITVGIVFAVMGGSNNTADAQTVKVWDEYETLTTQDSTDLATISYDPAALQKSQDELKKSQDKVAALQAVLKENGGTQARRNRTQRSNNTRDIKADQMEAALLAYKTYLTKMAELFATLRIGNLLDPNVVNTLNAMLKGLQTLAGQVKTLSNKFLADNAKVATTTFNPAILGKASTIATDVQKNVNAALTAEQQRLAAEKAAADQQAAAAAAAAEQQRQAAEAAAEAANALVTCPLCHGSGLVEGGDGWYYCGFCGGSGTVTRAKAATFNPADWAP